MSNFFLLVVIKFNNADNISFVLKETTKKIHLAFSDFQIKLTN